MKTKFIKNKKADIPITILVLGVFAVCALAITSFMIFKIEGSKDSLGIEVFEEIHADVEKFYFYQNVSFSPDQSAEKIGAQIQNNKLIIEKNNTLLFVRYAKNLE